MLENEVVTGLQPRIPGDARLAVCARGVAGPDQERGGALVGSLLPGLVASGHGRPGEPRKLQQFMSPACVEYPLTFGQGSASSGSQVMVREAASKRYKEGPAKVEEKINLFDIKKEVKEEVAKRFKDECAVYFNQSHKAAKEEVKEYVFDMQKGGEYARCHLRV